MMKKFFSKLNLVRFGLMAAMVAVVVLVMPRADHQSYSYELGQPWKYPLLTAQVDMPVLRDSATVSMLRDSIDKNFMPFVTRDNAVMNENIKRFSSASEGKISPRERVWLTGMLRQVYQRGIVESDLYENMQEWKDKKLRIAVDADEENNAVTTIDASAMFSPAKAFEYIDSSYNALSKNPDKVHMNSNIARALNISIIPNIVTDTLNDSRYREQEYLNVTGAQGVIKKGQRIVDRGEIVTPQIFTNLNTYQEILERENSESGAHTYFLAGQILYVTVCIALLYTYLFSYRRRFFDNIRHMVFLMTLITLFVVFAIVMFEYLSNGIYLVPFAALPVIILVFFDSRTAIFSLLTAILITAMVATFQFQFIFIETVVGIAATLSIHQLSKRSQLLRTAIISFSLYSLCYFIMCLITDGNLDNFVWKTIGKFAINSVLLSFAYLLIVVIEKVFGFISTVTLVELSDINNPVLRRLAEEAPGTFQHSMQVSTLAAEAARDIGANTQLARTGALYHDIGKLESPIFFTENQHGINPHEGLDSAISAKKIISHVTYGLGLATKYKLPQVIKDFITQHHGKGITKYFYNTAVNQNPDKDIDKTPFTYPGPNPTSKETTVLMMADAVEAASRSLKDYSSESIDNLVDKIIDAQQAEGLYKDSPVSFKDIETVKNTFKKRLATIYHGRIAYPGLNKKDAVSK